MRSNSRGRMQGNMLPLSGRLQRRHVAALALGIVVLAGGVYRFTGSRLAQVAAPTACIRSYGPFFESVAGGDREESVSVFPDGTRFLKVTGPKTVSLFTVDANGVVSKASDIQGDYQSAAVVAVNDTLAAIAYQEAGVAYYRLVRLNGVGGPSPEAPIKLIDIPAGFGQYVRFALDAVNGNQFVLVTNIPAADGPETLSAIVAGNMTSGALRPMGPYASPPAESPQAIMDFDVAAIDIGNTNTVTFVVAFRGANGAKFVRASDSPGGVVFAESYLADIGQTATSLDLGSSFERPRKAALTYKDNGSVYAGEIVLATATTDFDEKFSPTRISQNGDVVLGNGIDWVDEEFYVVAFGVQQSQNSPRKGTYIRRGVAGSSAFGSELKVTDVANPRSLTLSGIPGARGRILIAQTSTTAADTGLIASYCAGCVGGVSDVGEACVTASGTVPTGGGGDAPLCDPRFCGNSEAEPGEQCDDGNTQFGDGCDALCRLECTDDGDCPSGECAGGTCTNLCGNGIVEPPTCVSQTGPMTCPPPTAGDMRIVNLPGGIFPLTHRSADFNKDGKLDIVVYNYTGNTPPQPDGHGAYVSTIEVFLNNGDGTFQARKEIGVSSWNDGGGDRGLDAFDADGDGDADVVVMDGSSGGFVLLRNNNMVFTRVPFADGFHAFHLFHGEVNRDGDPDLGVDGFAMNNVEYSSVLLGDTGVTFKKSDVYTADGSYDTHEFADMDGDGDDDLVFIGASVLNGQTMHHSIAVRMSNGDGTFADATFMYAPGSSLIMEMDTGDFDDDGKRDVVLSENNDNAVVIFGDGAGGARSVAEVDTPFGPRLLAVADPSADGIDDVVFGAGQGTEGRNLWYAKSNGDGTFAAPVRFVTLNPPASGRPRLAYNNSYYYNFDLRSGDYDGDGRLDLSLVHTLTSDSASVILMRSSLNNCTQATPVVTCSQAEECDDGALNGESGKCTQRCSFCGNGVIDTVNGVAEACDDGVKNGDADSACSLQCATVSAPPRHLGCVGIGMCAIVDGPGDDQCLDGATDCTCLPSDPFCVHAACVNGACGEAAGPGMPLCSSNADCSVCPASDPNCHEKCDVLDMQCVASPTGGCPVKCEEERHLACQNEQCVIKQGAGSNGCSNSADCQDGPPKHLACVGIGACAVVDGAGDDQCLTGEDCECLPSDPSCTHAACSSGACIEVAGPGMPLCAANADCTPCPASNPNCHEQCDALDMQCVPSTSGSCPVKCEEERHLACRNEQCTSVVGAGINACDSQEDCEDDTPRHLTCIGIGACAIVDGEGADSCLTGGDCTCLPSDPSCTHAACVNGACAEVPGSGIPLCAANADCTPCPASDPNCHERCAAIQMQCVGAPVGSCDSPNCAEERHLTCQNEQCVAVDGAGPNTCSSEADCEGIAPKHLACVGIGACAIVDGDGDDECLDGATDCTCLPSDPFCVHAACVNGACGEAAGPGMALCASNADCSPCPASNPNCHEKCEVLNMQCTSAPTGSCPVKCEENRHLACQNEQCVIKQGAGSNGCASSSDCIGRARSHLSCVGIGACAIVDGEASDSCLTGSDCGCSPSDPSCTHAACVNGACAEVAGPGIPLCTANSDCTPCPASDPNCHQQCAAIQMQCEAAPLGSCNSAECAEPRHLVCQNEQCASVPGAGQNECDVRADCLVPRHLACTGVGACTLVEGAGSDSCLIGEDCDCSPTDPTCTHAACVNGACGEVAGPGIPLCSSNDECTPCPASDPNCHEACSAIQMQCVGAPLGGCAADDCAEERHLTCRNEQCASVPGAGENECDSTADCVVTLCGNGTLDTGEDCDEGPNNRTGTPTDLSTWYCKAPMCTRSECFDGGDNDHDNLPDSMDAGCWLYDVPTTRANRPISFLGFLLAQTPPPLEELDPLQFLAGKDNESCPAETVDRGSFCALTCEAGDICPGGEACPEDGVCPVLCPNGAIDDNEDCDDGNLEDGDLCSNICRLNPCTGPNCPRCGDGVYQHQIGEQCDDGNAVDGDACTNNCRTRCDGNDDCQGLCDLATQQCLPATCGDAETNQAWERCDDGNVVNDDQCNNQCQPTCKGNADCESGKCDQAKQVCVPLCGNGTVDSQEQCDDGNMIDKDQCSSQCLLHCSDDSTCDCDEEAGVCRPLCGNGRVDTGEGCDDGNTDNADACSNRCQVRCRPGTMCPDNQACPQNGLCPVPGECGDGVVNDASEQCDDGNKVDGDGCSNACKVRCAQNLECPSGLLCIGQECSECTNSLQCSDGFCVEGRCRQALPICGNGAVEPGEVCDDANGDDADGCTSSCLFPRDHACVASAQCQTKLCEGQVCTPCTSAGQCGSGLRCAEGNCLFGGEQCGDATVQAGEACDDANLNEQDQCTSACLLPFGRACTHATQCASTICSAGSCTPCRGDSECSGGLRCAIGLCLTDQQMSLIPNMCGNGFVEGGEACDDGNGAYGDGCTPSCQVGNSPSRSEVAANVNVQLPFSPMANVGEVAGGGLHAGASGGLSDTGPATVAVMAAGAAAGTAWVRRKFGKKR